MKLRDAEQFVRAQSAFPAVDAGARDRQRKEDVGIAEHVVVEVVAGGGSEVSDVQRPSGNRDGEPELVLFVAFAAQRQKSESLLCRHIEHRAAHGQ